MNNLKVEKVAKGKYQITRLDDNKVYLVIKSKSTGEWIIERQSDNKIDYDTTLAGCKLMIGEWRYI